MAWRAEMDEGAAKHLAACLQKSDTSDEEMSDVLDRTAKLACSRRSCVYLLESGAVSALIQLLIDRAAVPRASDPLLLQVCNTLTLLCHTEPECAVAVGLAEAHPVLQRLMTQCVDEDVQEAAAAVALECSRCRGGFPLRRVPLGGVAENVVLPWRVVVSDPSHPPHPSSETASLSERDASSEAEGEGGVQLMLQRVGVRMGSQFDTGFALWPAAMILARYLLAHRSLVAGRCVVEVGSGLGLCGLTAAQLCPRHVIISEANDACLHAIHDAIQLNPTTNTSTGGACEGVLCEAKWLDWDHVYPLTEDTTDPGSESDSEGEREGGQRGVRVGEVGEEGEEGGEEEWRRKGWVCAPIETLLASDVIHDESCARGMARLIRLALKDDGVALVLAPCPQHRYGVDTFPKHLKAQGLEWEEEAMGGGYVDGVKDADVMHFKLFLITQPKKAPPTC